MPDDNPSARWAAANPRLVALAERLRTPPSSLVDAEALKTEAVALSAIFWDNAEYMKRVVVVKDAADEYVRIMQTAELRALADSTARTAQLNADNATRNEKKDHRLNLMMVAATVVMGIAALDTIFKWIGAAIAWMKP